MLLTMIWYRQKDKQEVIRVKPDLSGGKGGSLAEPTINENEDVLMLAETVMRRLEALETISQQGKRITWVSPRAISTYGTRTDQARMDSGEMVGRHGSPKLL